jgi:hypothetical protein
VAFHRSLHTEAQFLFLVQALEVYHACCPAFDSTNKYLDERLTEIFLHHSTESAEILGSDRSLPEKIRYTRNHLTHHTGDETSPKLLKGNELLQINWNLRTFVWVCLLKEIGLSGPPINRLIRKYGDVRFVTLG